MQKVSFWWWPLSEPGSILQCWYCGWHQLVLSTYSCLVLASTHYGMVISYIKAQKWCNKSCNSPCRSAGMMKSAPNITVRTITYITPPVHRSIICGYFVMGLYNNYYNMIQTVNCIWHSRDSWIHGEYASAVLLVKGITSIAAVHYGCWIVTQYISAVKTFIYKL